MNKTWFTTGPIRFDCKGGGSRKRQDFVRSTQGLWRTAFLGSLEVLALRVSDYMLVEHRKVTNRSALAFLMQTSRYGEH
jgi:hypothetical protein